MIIYIYHLSFSQDANDNRLKQYPRPDETTSPNSEHGVFEGELQLSEQPVQGTWKITVDAEVGALILFAIQIVMQRSAVVH